MDLNTEKIELLKLLLQIDDLKVLNNVRTILQNGIPDFYKSLPGHVKENITAGIKDVEYGNF